MLKSLETLLNLKVMLSKGLISEDVYRAVLEYTCNKYGKSYEEMRLETLN